MPSVDVIADEQQRPPGVVTVSAAVRAPAPQVWHALTDTHTVGEWFGTLASPLALGEMTTITLPDGDHFLLQVTDIEPPSTLRYVWAALSIGLENTVTWRIVPGRGESVVTVTDSEPERIPPQARRDEQRWSEILHRLGRFLGGAGSIGHPCQNGFDASMEFAATVEGAWGLLLEPQAHGRWLPLDGGCLQDGAVLKIDDGLEPVEFRADEVRADSSEHRLSFRLHHPDWLHPTTCVLETRPRREGTMVTIRHDGWRTISLDGRQQQRQRSRWCKVWSGALRRFTLLYVRSRALSPMPSTELRSRLGEPGLHILDTNAQAKWDQGHLPGATHIGPEPLTPEVLPPDKTATLVFYCWSSL